VVRLPKNAHFFVDGGVSKSHEKGPAHGREPWARDRSVNFSERCGGRRGSQYSSRVTPARS